MRVMNSVKKLNIDDPIDKIEEFINHEQWPYYRLNDQEIALEIPGQWGEYRLQFVWQSEFKVLQLYCTLDLDINPPQFDQIYKLLNLINNRLSIGHFEVSQEDFHPAYRHGILILHINIFSSDFFLELIDVAILESERFYTIFQSVIQDCQNATDALSSTILDTMGEA